jgi:three-Cys-motif partner protein
MTSEAYEDREQTEVKHKILERYLSGAVPVLGSWAKDIAYIDCLAGPWKSAAPDLGDTSFARAIAVLRKTRGVLASRGKRPTLRCLLIEKDPDAYAQLETFATSVTDLPVTTKPWDFSKHVPDVVRYALERDGCFPFSFIDPKGWELAAIPLIAPILKLDPGEVLINLMTSWITRFLSDTSKPFEELLGASAVKHLRTLRGHEQEEALVRSYAESVRHAGGYKFVCTLPVMKSGSDAFHFYMVYGTRHEKGVEVFKQTENAIVSFMHDIRAKAQRRRKVQATGQDGLFPEQVTYRERRYTRFREKNLEIAKDAARAQLRQRTVDFDDLWADCMQYPTVLESDLQGWIDDWGLHGKIEVLNMPPRQRVLHRGQGLSLRWKDNGD